MPDKQMLSQNLARKLYHALADVESDLTSEQMEADSLQDQIDALETIVGTTGNIEVDFDSEFYYVSATHNGKTLIDVGSSGPGICWVDIQELGDGESFVIITPRLLAVSSIDKSSSVDFGSQFEGFGISALNGRITFCRHKDYVYVY